MKKLIKDILYESKEDDKYSSKKVMGITGGLLAFVSFVVDGFHFYEIDTDMFNSMLIFSATMLGASVVKHFGSKN